MSYNLPFIQGQKIIELGGGPGTALFHPNLDMRPGPGVDIVANLNEPLPCLDNEYDGVFCKFMLEHISWRKIKSFIREIYRILKPGGQAVFITANLLEQARMLVEAPYLTEDHVGMIFGDQNYSGPDWRANAHYTGFSPESAGRMFREAGFDRVIVLRWPAIINNKEWIGDMIVEIKKPEAVFDKKYFHGGEAQGGYLAYRDMPSNWIIFQKIMERKPESILELGCGRGYLLKRFQDAGVRAKGLDISPHCYMTRVANQGQPVDITQTPWPFADKEFDFCLSVDVLRCLPPATLPAVFSEINRCTRRGLHTGEGLVLPEGQELVALTGLIDGNIWDALPPDDGLLKVNAGSYSNQFHSGWINIDILDLYGYAKENHYKFIQRDVTKGLPFEPNSVDLMYSSHMIEHLSYEDGAKFLQECHRIMKPGAVLRLMFPDAERLVNKYKDGTLADYHEINDGCETALGVGKLWAILFEGHKAAYDWNTINEVAGKVGLKATKRKFREGEATIIKETFDMLPKLSLFVELIK